MPGFDSGLPGFDSGLFARLSFDLDTMKTASLPGWFAGLLIVVGLGFVPGVALGQNEPPIENSAGAAGGSLDDEELDAGIKEELAKVGKLVADGKLPRAIKTVEELFEKTGHLRAGFALLQLQQMQALDLSAKNHKKAHPVFLKSGDLARRLLADPAFPAVVRDEVVAAIYNEACSHAFMEENQLALNTLGDLFSVGFEDFSKIENDPVLRTLAQTEEFREVVAKARESIRDRMDAGSKQEIAGFRSFAFDFEQTDLAGRPLSLASLKGKIVIVDFWGTWCPPCRAEIPSFIRLKDAYANDLEIVGLAYERVDAAEAPQAVIDYGLKSKINYPCAIGAQETKEMVPEFRGYPTTLFIDRTGKVRMVTVGNEPYDKLESLVRILMDESGGK